MDAVNEKWIKEALDGLDEWLRYVNAADENDLEEIKRLLTNLTYRAHVAVKSAGPDGTGSTWGENPQIKDAFECWEALSIGPDDKAQMLDAREMMHAGGENLKSKLEGELSGDIVMYGVRGDIHLQDFAETCATACRLVRQ